VTSIADFGGKKYSPMWKENEQGIDCPGIVPPLSYRADSRNSYCQVNLFRYIYTLAYAFEDGKSGP
jgi:hypothetical protein